MPAMSPRKPAPKLESTNDKPRSTETPYSRLALQRGYTVKVTEATDRKLKKRRGIPKELRKEDG